MSTSLTYTFPFSNPATVRSCLQMLYFPRKWQHLLRIHHAVYVNQKSAHMATSVHFHDQLCIDTTPLFDDFTFHQHYVACNDWQPDIIYETPTFAIINKPRGVKTHPNQPQETGTLMNALTAYWAPSYQPYITHRLDQETSGAILVAKTFLVVPMLNQQLATKSMGREYLAWVETAHDPIFPQLISDPIGLDPTDQRKRQIRSDGQPARTEVTPLLATPNHTLVHLKLQTGRTHQLRVHLAAHGWPIVNDPLYSKTDAPTPQPLQLHAVKLYLTQPLSFSSQSLSVKCPLPQDFYHATWLNQHLKQWF